MVCLGASCVYRSLMRGIPCARERPDTRYNLALKFGDFEWYRTISRSRLLKLHILLRKRMLSFSKKWTCCMPKSERRIWRSFCTNFVKPLLISQAPVCRWRNGNRHAYTIDERKGLFNRIFVMSFAAPLFSAPGNFPHFCVYQCTPLTWHMGNLYEERVKFRSLDGWNEARNASCRLFGCCTCFCIMYKCSCSAYASGWAILKPSCLILTESCVATSAREFCCWITLWKFKRASCELEAMRSSS